MAPSADPPHADCIREDLSLLSFLLAVHALPLIALAAGRSWGAGTNGYAAAVVLLGSRELVRELHGYLLSRGGSTPGRP